MPARSSHPNSGAVASLAQDSKKRAFNETQESTLSPRRSKRTRSSVENPTTSPTTALATQTPRKLGRQVSANNKSKATTLDIKEEDLVEVDDLKPSVHAKKQKASIAAQGLGKGVKQEVEIEEKEVIATKTTKQRKTKAEKEAEMLPLAARTKGLQMFVGAHVSAAKGWYSPFI
jgi:AP endonuclease-1